MRKSYKHDLFIVKNHLFLLLATLLCLFPLFLQGQFTEIGCGITIPSLTRGSVLWGDTDNDGDLDLLLSGRLGGLNSEVTFLYSNNGLGFFTGQPSGLAPVYDCYNKWSDYDRDSDLDILMSGLSLSSLLMDLFRNDNGYYTNSGVELIDFRDCRFDWGDYDNDGDEDVIATGYLNDIEPFTKLFRNEDSCFTEIQAGLPLIGGQAIWGDYDNDCDLDLFLSGYTYHQQLITDILRNDNGVFNNINVGISVFGGETFWIDYNNDGYLDLFTYGNGQTHLFRNDGNDIFTDIAANIVAVYEGKYNWGDYDNDGDLDVLLTGGLNNSSPYNPVTRIYVNNGNDTFSDLNAGLPGLYMSSVAWGDCDNDCDLDFFLIGQDVSLYRNDVSTPNTPPTAPANLRTETNGDYVLFSWDPSTDDHTPSSGLTYALRIGSSPGACDILSPKSEPTGCRLLPGTGNINSNCSWKIKSSGLPQQYYWSVQAIDTAFAGSPFAEEISNNLVPSAPQNLSLSISDDDVILQWEPVTTSILGTFLLPDIYLVFYNSDFPLYDDYYVYLSQTDVSNYTHEDALLTQPRMFYRVVAVKYNNDGQEPLIRKLLNRTHKITLAEVKEILK